jgi:diadenosine tetraphosphate (Ap4A) HIT family hydrolase
MVSGIDPSCLLCGEDGPQDVIAELEATWVSASQRAPLPGYVCVIAKRHVVEPFEFPPEQMLAFFADTMTTARAVAALLAPTKMNYEIHGNTIPHLHMHLYPRFLGDPFEGRPIDPAQSTFDRSAEDLRRLAEAIKHS